MYVRTVASQSKIIIFAELCLYAQDGAFYCFLYTSLSFFDSLFWVGLFQIQTDQTTPVSSQSRI